MEASDCVSDQDLALMIEGKLQRDDTSLLTRHVDDCLDCRVVLREATWVLEELRRRPPLRLGLSSLLDRWTKAFFS